MKRRCRIILHISLQICSEKSLFGNGIFRYSSFTGNLVQFIPGKIFGRIEAVLCKNLCAVAFIDPGGLIGIKLFFRFIPPQLITPERIAFNNISHQYTVAQKYFVFIFLVSSIPCIDCWRRPDGDPAYARRAIRRSPRLRLCTALPRRAVR